MIFLYHPFLTPPQTHTNTNLSQWKDIAIKVMC